jgi:hypothetical protein
MPQGAPISDIQIKPAVLQSKMITIYFGKVYGIPQRDLLVCLGMNLLVAVPALAQQVTWVPGSPSATTISNEKHLCCHKSPTEALRI